MWNAGKSSLEMRSVVHSGFIVKGVVGVKKILYVFKGDSVSAKSCYEIPA